MTAAHCLVGRVERDILVRAGTKHQGLGGELLRVFKIIRHPSYDPETEFMDVALLQLARNITLKPREKEIIKLAAQGEVTADGSLAMVTGWGETKSVKDSNKMLRGVIIPIVNIDVCKQTNKNLMDDVICAGDYEKGGKDACQGKEFIKCYKYFLTARHEAENKTITDYSTKKLLTFRRFRWATPAFVRQKTDRDRFSRHWLR